MYLFVILILKWTLMGVETQIGHWPGNCHLINCSISFRQLYSPVKGCSTYFVVPFHVETCALLAFPVSVDMVSVKGTALHQNWKQNYQSKPPSLPPSAAAPPTVTPVALRGRWRSTRGGVGESWLHNNFSIYYSTSPVLLDGIAASISESRKIALKMYMTQYIFSSRSPCWREAVSAGVGWNCRTFAAWVHFSSCKWSFPYFKKLVYSGARPLFHCCTGPNALQWHRSMERFQLSD